MMRRFCSGSVDAGEPREEALARVHVHERHVEVVAGTRVTTCSASFLRSRPWSTNTQVSRSPIARCTISAATDESTPPDSPQIARPSPTCSRISATCSSMIEAGRPPRSQPQTS